LYTHLLKGQEIYLDKDAIISRLENRAELLQEESESEGADLTEEQEVSKIMAMTNSDQIKSFLFDEDYDEKWEGVSGEEKQSCKVTRLPVEGTSFMVDICGVLIREDGCTIITLGDTLSVWSTGGLKTLAGQLGISVSPKDSGSRVMKKIKGLINNLVDEMNK